MSLWIVVFVVFLLPLAFWALLQLRMHNDVAGWLPKNDPQAKVLHWYQNLFPHDDRVLVSWDSCSVTDPRIKRFAEVLAGTRRADGVREGGSPLIGKVTLPTDVLSRMLDQNIPFATAIDQLDGVLVGKGPLRIRLTEAGRMRGEYIRQEILSLANDTFRLNARIVNHTIPLPSSAGLSLDDTKAQRLHESLHDYVSGQPLYDLQLTWDGIHTDPKRQLRFQDALLALKASSAGTQTAGKPCIDELFFVTGTLAATSVSFSESGSADRDEAVAAIRNAARIAQIPDEELHLGGQPVVGTALNLAMKNTAWNPAATTWDLVHKSIPLLSALVTIVLTFVLLRSFRLALLVQSVSVLTVLLSTALVPATGTSMNMVLIVMPTLLSVLTTSAAIHLANYWKHSNLDHPTASVIQAVRTAWLPCALASATTAIGLASLMSSNLVPVFQFGVYAAIGCGISFLVVMYLMPSLMLYWPRSPPPEDKVDTTSWNRLGRLISRYRVAVTSVCVIGTLACGYGLTRFRTETKVIRYFPADSRLVQDYEFLEQNLAGIVSIDTIVRFDEKVQESLSFIERARKVREIQRDIRNHSEVSGVLSLASFLDLRQPDTTEMSWTRRKLLAKKQNEIGQKIFERLETGGTEAEDVAGFIARPTDSADWLETGDRALHAPGDELWRITAQAVVMSDMDFEVLTGDMDAIARKHLGLVNSARTSHIVTGMIPLFLRTQQAVLESLIRSFAMAFVVIACVMMIVLKSFRAGVATMLPNLMPVVIVFGLLSWGRLRVDIGTMITASVALGIAVDGTLHLLTWFKELVRRGYSVHDAVAKSLEHCGPAMWQTSAAVGIGMLTLLPAELLLISRFGWMLAALIFAALVADIVFLPALLAGPLGRIIQQATLAGQTEDVDDSSDSETRLKLQKQAADDSRSSQSSGEAVLRPHMTEVDSIRQRRILDS